jgi:hypothetical protein
MFPLPITLTKWGIIAKIARITKKQKPIQTVVRSMRCIGISLIGIGTSYPIILDLVWFIVPTKR